MKCTVTSLLYQPFVPGVPAVIAAEIVGMVLSIFTATVLLAALTFPALSVTVRAVDVPEAVRTWSAGQDTMPDVPSVQVKCMLTSALYQPAAVGEVVAAAVIVGGVLSILTVTVLL